MLVLAVLSAGLVLFNWVELAGLLAGTKLLLLAIGASAVWVTMAWLASLAARRRRWDLTGALAGVAAVLWLLLATWRGFLFSDRWILGGLVGTFILVLAVGAAVLIAHTESASLLVARQRWHLARAEYELAARTREADLEAAALALEAWLSLVRAWAMMIPAGDEGLLGEIVSLATALLGGSPPMLPS
jgi:hypothetical protein